MICKRTLPGHLTEGQDYQVRNFHHSFIHFTPLTKQTTLGKCDAIEVIDNQGSPLIFTEQPSAKWHIPMEQFSTYLG